jgi:NADH-quinone oxidoreductase subunit G
VVIVENDLYRRAEKSRVDAALARAQHIIVVDHQQTATSEKAHILLPAASFAEGNGTVVSSEGRAQRFFQVYDPVYYKPDTIIHESWRWLHAVQSTLKGQEVEWTQLDEVTAHCATANPALAGIEDAAPNAAFRLRGLKIARSPRRYSGRTAMRAPLSVHEPRAPQDQDSALAFSMEGYAGPEEPAPLIPFAWAPGWNSPQAWNKFQDEVGGHLRTGDPGVRLIEGNAQQAYFSSIPAAFTAGASLRAAPLYHLFGSEELTARAEPVQERIPDAYVALSQSDANRLGLAEGAEASIKVAGELLTLPVRISSTLPVGIVGLPVGISGAVAFAGKPVLVGAAA